MPTPPTSASGEQLFSVGGRIVSSARSRLNAHNVNGLCCPQLWLIKHEDMISTEATHKADEIAKTDKRFLYLNLRLDIDDPEIIGCYEDLEDDDDDYVSNDSYL